MRTVQQFLKDPQMRNLELVDPIGNTLRKLIKTKERQHLGSAFYWYSDKIHSPGGDLYWRPRYDGAKPITQEDRNFFIAVLLETKRRKVKI